MIKRFKNLAYKIAERKYNKIKNIDKKSFLRKVYFAFDKYPEFMGYSYKVSIYLVSVVGLFFNVMLFKDFPCVIISGTGMVCSIYVVIGMFVVINLFIIVGIFMSLIFYHFGDLLIKNKK